jgi:hypothetical protein
MSNTMRACPMYADGIWGLHCARPSEPGRFRMVSRDFRTRAEAEDHAREIARSRRWQVEFVATCIEEPR